MKVNGVMEIRVDPGPSGSREIAARPTFDQRQKKE